MKVLDTGPASARRNMQTDADLLETLADEPILHFYEWEKRSITFGYFVKPEELLHLKNLEKQGIDYARRPTGGGVVFHLWDLAFSVLIPSSSPHFSQNSLENYAYINHAVLRAVEKFLGTQSLELIPQDELSWDQNCGSFCMAKPTKYDLVLKGRKIAGAAQRKRKQGYLHQGTIALLMPEEKLLQELLLNQGRVAEAMMAYTYPLLGKNSAPDQVARAKKELKTLLQQSLI